MHDTAVLPTAMAMYVGSWKRRSLLSNYGTRFTELVRLTVAMENLENSLNTFDNGPCKTQNSPSTFQNPKGRTPCRAL
jgi:hypothetical protein